MALDAPTHKRAFLYGWLTGTAANAVAFSWMDGLLERFGHMPLIESLPIMGLLVGYQGLAFALFSWAVRRFQQRTKLPLVVLAPLLMVAIEVGMPQMFPYYLAISQAFVPIVIQIADITGPLGVTALMVALNGAMLRCLAAARPGDPRRRARSGRGRGADRRGSRVRRVAPAPGRRPPRRRAQGPDRGRAGERRHPREVGSGRIRAAAGDAPEPVGRRWRARAPS